MGIFFRLIFEYLVAWFVLADKHARLTIWSIIIECMIFLPVIEKSGYLTESRVDGG